MTDRLRLLRSMLAASIVIASCGRGGSDHPASTTRSEHATGTVPATAPSPTGPPLDPTEAIARIAGIYPGDNALAVIVASPARILIQRQAANVVASISDLRCEPAASAEAPIRCTFRTDACDGTLRATRTAAIGGRSAELVITATPRATTNMIACATLSLHHEFTQGGPPGSSVPGAAVGAPRELPAIPNAACLVSTFEPSASGAACLVRASETGFDAYLGACCLGTRVASFSVTDASLPRSLSGDGRILVAAARPLQVAPVDVRTDAVLLVAQIGETRRELRVRELLRGDAALTEGTSFGIVFEIEGSTLVVRAIGGAPHRISLGG